MTVLWDKFAFLCGQNNDLLVFLANQKSSTGHLLRDESFSEYNFSPRRPNMPKRLVVFAAALALCSAAVAHADSITGFFSATGSDSFTAAAPFTLTFAPGTSQVALGSSIGGTFATYLTDGNPITFASGPIPFVIGNNTPPSIPIFSTTENGETFSFIISGLTQALPPQERKVALSAKPALRSREWEPLPERGR